MDYDIRLRGRAAKSLAPIAQKGKGQVVTLTHPPSGAFNPVTESIAGSPVVTYGSGIESEYNLYRMTSGEVPGSMVQSGDKRFYLSTMAIDPTTGWATGLLLPPPVIEDTILLASGVWTIKNVTPISPAGRVIMFELQLRGVQT